MTTALDPGLEGTPAAAPLGRALGLSEIEFRLLGKVFVEAAEGLGIDGTEVFRGLAAGRTMGEALRLPAGTEDLLYARAHQWFTAGRPDRAESLFRAICVLDPSNADAWVGAGVCNRLRDAHDAAAMAFEVAMSLRPDWAVPHFHAFELALTRGDLVAAEARLAAFDARRDDSLPEALVAEADRMRGALAFRKQRAAG